MGDLLDTDAVIDFLKGVTTTVALVIQLLRERRRLCVCDVVVCEVYSGLQSSAQRHRAEELLAVLEYIPTSVFAARQAGEWRSLYRSQGIQLSATDCLIAAVALEHGLRVITANVRDYPMPELHVLPLARA